jgi:hypothetical protein
MSTSTRVHVPLDLYDLKHAAEELERHAEQWDKSDTGVIAKRGYSPSAERVAEVVAEIRDFRINLAAIKLHDRMCGDDAGRRSQQRWGEDFQNHIRREHKADAEAVVDALFPPSLLDGAR